MADRRRKRILVADDTLPMRVMLQDLLTEAGYEVMTAADGEQAWVLLQEEGSSFDLLILDLLMPRMTGFEILERKKELPLPSHQKVLAITGIFKRREEIQRLKELGAAGYITKSALVDEVLFRVNQVFHLGQQEYRSFPRALISLPVDYQHRGENLSNYISNFSAGGVFIRTIDPAPLNETLQISLRIPELNQVFSLKGRVVWTNEYQALQKKTSLPGMGVQFVDLDTELQRSLTEYVLRRLREEPVWLNTT